MKQKLTRRRFLKAAGAATAAVIVPTLFDFERVAHAAPLVRRNIASLTTFSHDIVAYRKGIRAMQALPTTDPRSWDYQAAIHGTTLAGAHPAWHTCEHHTYFFWSWHRMYLYWFERIVRRMSGSQTFSLPYWNYSASAAQRKLPAVFRETQSVLFVADRNENMNNGTGSLFAPWLNTEPGMDELDFGLAQGTLESTPHDNVHTGVGGGMSFVDTAALDPLFYVHHANVDRLWNLWLARRGGRMNPLGPSAEDTEWRTRKFTFFDENGAAVEMTGCDVMRASQQLNYTYEGGPKEVNQFCILIVRPSSFLVEEVVVRWPTPLVITRTGRATFPVELKGARGRVERLTRSRTEALVLNLEEVTAEQQPGVVFELYLGLPEGAEPDPRSAHFVGHFSLFSAGIRGRTHHFKPARFSFRVNRALAAALRRRGDRLDLTVVGRGIVVEGRRPAPQAAASEVRIGNAAISVRSRRRR